LAIWTSNCPTCALPKRRSKDIERRLKARLLAGLLVWSGAVTYD
jgi:hypothetical protein